MKNPSLFCLLKYWWLKLNEFMIDVVIVEIKTELTKNTLDVFLPLVSTEKQNRIKQFCFFRDARNCLLGDILVRNEICRITGLRNEQIVFSTSEYGKPFLVNDYDIHFNISHAGDYIACAISNEPVGIDVEVIRVPDFRIAQRFYSPDEMEYVMEDKCKYRFYEIWTKKESRIKWEGKGLYKSLASFSVLCKEQKEISYNEVLQNNDIACHICSTKQKLPSIKLMEFGNFMQKALQHL